MRPDEYLRYDALGLAGLVRRGEVRAVELVDAAAAQIEQGNARTSPLRTRPARPSASYRRYSSGRMGPALYTAQWVPACAVRRDAIHESTRASSTSSGIAPPLSSSSWNARTSKAAPSSFFARSRSAMNLSWPIL